MSKRLFASALTLFLCSTSAFAATITPVSVTASSTFPFWDQYKAVNLINGSGMSGALHDGTYTNMWMTDLGPQNAVLTFDLGSVYSLGAISLWNYNTDFGMGYSLARGVKDFTIELSTDGLDFTAALGDTLDKGTGMPLAGQSFGLTGDARYVRMNILSGYGDQYTGVGLSEVNFGAVPEPASWTMMITGFGLVGAAMRRRKAAATLA